MLNISDNIGLIEHHIFFFDDIDEIKGIPEMSSLKPHMTFHRGIISYTFCNEEDETYGSITNMMGILVITFYKKGPKEKWIETEILNDIGFIEAKNQNVTTGIFDEFIHILRTAQSSSNSISKKQTEKIIKNAKDKSNKIKDYPIFQDWINDQELK